MIACIQTTHTFFIQCTIIFSNSIVILTNIQNISA